MSIVTDHIKSLIKKAAEAESAEDAIQFSQAAEACARAELARAELLKSSFG